VPSPLGSTLEDMGVFLFLAFIVLPIAELAVIVVFARNIGLLWTLVMLFGFSIAGSILAKQQGLDVWRRMRATLARGEMPSSEVVDGFLILLAGALLLTPGFLTDAVGVVLLVPPARAAVRRIARRVFGRYVDHRVFGPPAGQQGARQARVVRVARREEPPETGI
jgi:UPF0716 protein FxsA